MAFAKIESYLQFQDTTLQNVWEKFLKPLKALNCGIVGNKIQHVLWCSLKLYIFSNLKDDVLCGTNNLQLDSPEDIDDGIFKIAK